MVQPREDWPKTETKDVVKTKDDKLVKEPVVFATLKAKLELTDLDGKVTTEEFEAGNLHDTIRLIRRHLEFLGGI